MSEWMSVTEAAQLCGKSERTVWRWIDKGRVVSRTTDEGGRVVSRDSLPGLTVTDATDTPDSVTDTGPDYHALWRSALDRESEALSKVKRLEAELEHVAGERDFLRDRLTTADIDRQATLTDLRDERERSDQAQRELRVLLQAEQQAAAVHVERIRDLEGRLALPAPKPRAWWKVWGGT